MDAHEKTTPVAAKLLTISDVRDLLQISRGSVYALIRRRELVPVRVGARLRFTQDEIAEFLRRYRQGASP